MHLLIIDDMMHLQIMHPLIVLLFWFPWQLPSSLMRTSTSARRAAGSSSRDAVFAGSDADASRPATGDPSLQKVSSGHRISPFVSSEHPRSFSARVASNEHNLESTIKKIEGLNVSNEERP